VNEVWAALMLVAGGLFAGGAATFAWSRVPIWRQMPLSEFVSDFEQTIRRTDKVQPALLVVAAVSAIGSAVTANGAARLFAALGAGGFILVLVASLAVLVPLQRRIIATPLAQATDVEAMRRRWFSGNLGRSVLSVASFALMVVATIV
jgi:anthrone oxygenase-like protein